METSKWLLVFWAVLVFLFEKRKFLPLTYPEFILKISKTSHISLPVLVEIFLSILTPQEHLQPPHARSVIDRPPVTERALAMWLLQMQGLALLLPCLYHPKQQSHCNYGIVPRLLNAPCFFKVSTFSDGFPGSPAWCGLLVPALCFFNSPLQFCISQQRLSTPPSLLAMHFSSSLFLSVPWVPLACSDLRMSVQRAGGCIAIHLLSGWDVSLA